MAVVFDVDEDYQQENLATYKKGSHGCHLPRIARNRIHLTVEFRRNDAAALRSTRAGEQGLGEARPSILASTTIDPRLCLGMV